MKIIELYNDYNVNYQTEGHKHCRPGWVNSPCPYCPGNPGLHLGYSLEDNYFKCWRCGWHPTDQTLALLTRIDIQEIRRIIKQYGGRPLKSKRPEKKTSQTRPHKLPTGTGDLTTSHIQYLRKRNFDPIKLAAEWGLQGTGPISKLDKLDFKHRIIAPIFWEDRQVSFQTRSLSSHSKVPYIACPMNRERIQHKHILYGNQEKWKSTGICVEGITDVWRFGSAAFATFGIEYTRQQILAIINTNFKRIAVIFDDDPQARIQADKLIGELRFAGIEALRVDIVGDPASMSQEDADYLVHYIMGK